MSLREWFDKGEHSREIFEKSGSLVALEESIHAYGVASNLVCRLSLYSANESIEDIATTDLRYVLTEHHLGTLYQQIQIPAKRLENLQTAARYNETFLLRCRNYGLVLSEERSAVDRALDHNQAKTASMSAADTRQEKIERFRRDKFLADQMLQISSSISTDEETSRARVLYSIYLGISRSLQEHVSINLELVMLKRIPVEQEERRESNDILQPKRAVADTWRLDVKRSPLDINGKVLSPFIITSKRDSLRSNVFRPDHSLPTMSIDDYLELERARGGIQDQAERLPNNAVTSGEKEEAMLELERRKAVAWDEFTEENPKGLGNTMNRG